MMERVVQIEWCYRIGIIITVFLSYTIQVTAQQKKDSNKAGVTAASYRLRPFYNIAHMVNSINEVQLYLERGANAIEADVTFSNNGSAIFTFHGYPCDCFRHCTEKEEFKNYIEYIRDITTPGKENYKKELVLLFLDLKISQLEHSAKAIAGQDLASAVVRHLFDNGNVRTKVRLLLSVGHIFDYDFILGFENELVNRKLQHLNDLIGWDVGLNDPIFVIESMWKRVEIVKNIWQGDGRTNCLSPFYNLGRLTTALRRRDETNAMRPKTYIDKVYHWTIDLTVNIRASLRTGVDGIITNHPERVVNILRETEFTKKFRLATQEDNPWERMETRTSVASPAAPSMRPIGIRVVNSIGDMLGSFRKYVTDFVYLRAPSNKIIKGKSANQLKLLDVVMNAVEQRSASIASVASDDTAHRKQYLFNETEHNSTLTVTSIHNSTYNT